MEHSIIDKPEFKVVGKAIRIATKDGENFRLIPQFWEQCQKDGTLGHLRKLAAADSLGNVTLGICEDFAPNMEEFTYMIAAENADEPISDGFVSRTIPAATWAVFESTGAMPNAIQNVWGKIWGEFFAAGEHVHGAAPDLEVYPPGNPMSSDYRCEVWVPVVKQ